MVEERHYLGKVNREHEDYQRREPTGTDAEACAYLNTASLTMSMHGDWTQIYLYIAGQSYKRWNKGEMPADIAVDSISDYQIGELNRLKSWLYHQG